MNNPLVWLNIVAAAVVNLALMVGLAFVCAALEAYSMWLSIPVFAVGFVGCLAVLWAWMAWVDNRFCTL